MKEGHQLLRIRTRPEIRWALVFLHGFRGDADDTWHRFPTLLGTEVSLQQWDIFSIGYNTSFLPGSRGVWAADPELPILATQLRTEFGIPPLSGYENIAIAAHSMGGLIAQQALVEDKNLSTRTRHLFLFGTPSAGLRKASIISRLLGPLLGVQVHNMGEESDFIRNLRSSWSQGFGDHPGFGLYAIAGDRDQFVPPASSLGPFAQEYHRVVDGDHLSMVNPHDRDADVVRLVSSALTQAPEPEAPLSPLRLAAETGSVAPQGLAIAKEALAGYREFNREEEVVEAALVLDRDGKRDEAIALLEKYQHVGMAVHGTLAGRLKRRWLQEGDRGDGGWALGLYEQALGIARAGPESARKPAQIFYYAINIAFLKFVAFDKLKDAQEMAKLALENARASRQDIWSVATEAEAYLYLGEYGRSLEKYRQAAAMNIEPWQLLSVGQQAQYIAAKLANASLQDSLKKIFDP